MKIAIVGNFSAFNTEYFYMKAFEKLEHEIEFIDQYSGIPADRRKLLLRLLLTRTHHTKKIFESTANNEIIVNNIRDKHPDIVLIFKGETLSKQSISKISSEYSTFLFYPDGYRYQSLLKGRLEFFDCVFTSSNNHSLYYEMGAKNVITIPWACDPSFHRRIQTRKQYDIVFMGSPYLNRYSYLHELNSVHIFGPYWIFPPGIKHGSVSGDNFIKVINQAKINLNIQHPSDLSADAPAWRIFEVAGCGGFVLSSNIPSLKSYFPSIVTFRNHGEMIEKSQFYLDNESERDDISQSLMETCRSHHTFLKRAEAMENIFH